MQTDLIGKRVQVYTHSRHAGASWRPDIIGTVRAVSCGPFGPFRFALEIIEGQEDTEYLEEYRILLPGAIVEIGTSEQIMIRAVDVPGFIE